MDVMLTVPCRSYSTGAFDGCTACVDAALDAIAQAVAYLVGRSAPELVGNGEGALDLAYRMTVRVTGDDGRAIGTDELTVEQSIEAVPAEDEPAISIARADDPGGEEDADDRPETTMRLEDFQTVVDRLELWPQGEESVSGLVSGTLFGYERCIGRFEVVVGPR